MMWDILGHIGLILGIIVSIGSIFGYFAKALPIFKNLQAQNQQTRNHEDQSSNTNNLQYPTRNLIIPTVIGIILVSTFSFSIAYMNYHYSLTDAFLGIVTLNDIMVGFLAVIPLFFGAIYGFWVGLAVGGIGFFIGGTISAQAFPGAPGYAAIVISIGFAIIGSIAGMSQLKTHGRFNRLSDIIFTNIIGAIGVFISVCFVVYTMLILRNADVSIAPNFILSLTIPEMLPGLILLPFLLMSYWAISEQRKLKSTIS
jgi:hypothetical protein